MGSKKATKQGAQAALELGGAPTLAVLVKWYEEVILAHQGKGTRKNIRHHLRMAVAALPPRPTGGDIAEWLGGRVDRREVQPTTANQARKHIQRVYTLGQQMRWPLLLNPVAHFDPLPTLTVPPRGLAEPYVTYPALLAAMPDARARAFLSMQRRHGLRLSEALGLEPRHINWSADTVFVERQRMPWSSKLQELKTDTSKATFTLDEETARYLRQAARDAMRSGKVPRGVTRARFLFPYFQEELAGLMVRCRAVAPDDFPTRIKGERSGAAWHVFRHTYGTELANSGMLDRKVCVLMRHKHLSTTQGYIASIRGRTMPSEDLETVRKYAREQERLAAERASGGVTSVGTGTTTTRGFTK
ncbi:tyrosine-type recombinase/integrase [Corallococcus silvisoli]|uniref:tyrosine-type recombinase/integrase n=1 Tax=Corallococcus silvisoli TaxID=2697031 RepID=UPI001377E884|nr:site-specific integrase [Corallococcus silvisoli]NBD09627.1 tyrosine-type recombinase/integrase [Corallococcus silvisoli]